MTQTRRTTQTAPATTAAATPAKGARMQFTALAITDFQGRDGTASAMRDIGRAFSFEGQKGRGLQLRLEVNPVNADRVAVFLSDEQRALHADAFAAMPERLDIKTYRTYKDRRTNEQRTIGNVLGRAVRVQTPKASGYILYFQHLPTTANAEGIYEIALVEPLPEDVRKARQAERAATEHRAAVLADMSAKQAAPAA